jgi:ATP-dependent helicase/nuclease subunit B
MGEMFEERVTPETLAGLDMGAQSVHWARSQAVLGVVNEFFGEDAAMTAEARQARLVDRLTRQWREAPPDHPVLIAGLHRVARGDRTADGRGVARLPQGPSCLPGLDRDMPASSLGAADRGAAQARPRRRGSPAIPPGACGGCRGSRPDAIPEWAPVARPASAERNKLVSLALRPAPVTDQWRARDRFAGPSRGAAPCHLSQRAPIRRPRRRRSRLGLRQAAENGVRAALVSPDRNLTRQVAAALDRWNITPDDSAGEPLGLTAPGRFLRMVAQALSGPLTSEALVALLSHPLCHSGVDRGDASEVLAGVRTEGAARQGGVSRTGHGAGLGRRHAGGGRENGDRLGRLGGRGRSGPARKGPRPSRPRRRTVAMAEALAAGPGQDGSGGELYEKDAGVAARSLMDDLRAEAPVAAP